MSNADRVADIRNKLGPFWCLIDLLSMPVDDRNKIGDEKYDELLSETIYQCGVNRDLITAKLDEISCKDAYLRAMRELAGGGSSSSENDVILMAHQGK